MATVATYSGAVYELGQKWWDNDNSGEAKPTDPSVYGPSSNNTSTTSSSQVRSGPWVYIGEFDNAWIKRNFSLSNELPENFKFGDTITATVNVNIREFHIQYDQDAGEWKNTKAVGLLRAGNSAAIIDVVKIPRMAGGHFYWAQIDQ